MEEIILNAKETKEVVAFYKKNYDLAAAAAAAGPDCVKGWAAEALRLYTEAVEKSVKAELIMKEAKKQRLAPPCSSGACSRGECCTKKPKSKKDRKPRNERDEQHVGPFVRNFFEGTDVYITPGADVPGVYSHKRKKGETDIYSEFHDSYKESVRRYPEESIRFDLLTPVPYSDAFAAPMGPPGVRQNLGGVEPTLTQVSFRDRAIKPIN